MRILEGMKNTAPIQIHALNNQQINLLSNDSTQLQQSDNKHLQQQSNAMPLFDSIGTTNGDIGNASNLYNHEQQKRTNQNVSHENGARVNLEQQINHKRNDGINVHRSTNNVLRQQQQSQHNTSISSQNNKQMHQQNIGSSLSTPCAKALYDFDSKESG